MAQLKINTQVVKTPPQPDINPAGQVSMVKQIPPLALGACAGAMVYIATKSILWTCITGISITLLTDSWKYSQTN